MKRLVVTAEAEQDMVDAFDWYEKERAGLGDRFVAAVREVVARVHAEPQAYPSLARRVRRARVLGFPHSVLYREEEDAIVVIACFHGKRDPRVWQRRT